MKRGQGRPRMYELYNKFDGLKESFIQSTDEENTQLSWRHVLSKSYPLEEMWNKDLCEFTEDELDKLWGHLKSSTMRSLLTQYHIISKYIQYAIDKGYGNPMKINLALSFKDEDLSKYINKIWEKKKIIDREDLYDIIDSCENMQDASCIVLLFEGAGGLNLEELRNLKRTDVNEDKGIITLTKDDGTTRTLEGVDHESIQILLDAYKQEIYIKGNGKNLEKMRSATSELLNTDYIIKPVKRKDVEEKCSPQSIRQRINRIKKDFENEYITPTSIHLSGMIDYAKRYKEENNIEELTREDYKKIGERYGIIATDSDFHMLIKYKIEKYI